MAGYLKAVGLDTAKVRYSLAARCRPAKHNPDAQHWQKSWDNRPADFAELQACRKWLVEEIAQLTNLKVIIPLGNTALTALLNEPIGSGKGKAAKGKNITSMRGVFFYNEEFKVQCLPTYHPNYLISKPQLERHVIRDLRAVKEFCSGIRQTTSETKYYYFRTPEEAAKLFAQIRKAGEVAFDTETTSKDEFYGEKILNLSFSWASRTGVYLPIWEGIATDDNPGLINADELENYWVKHYGLDTWNFIYSELKSIFEDPNIRKIGQNAKFDFKFLYASLNVDGKPLGIQYNNFHFDVMVSHFCLDENSPHGLKELAEEFTDMGAYDSDLDEVYSEIKAYCTKENTWRAKAKAILDYWEQFNEITTLGISARNTIKHYLNIPITAKTPHEDVVEIIQQLKQFDLKILKPHYGMLNLPMLSLYAVRDSDCTYRLYKIFSKLLTDQGLDNIFYNVRMPINKCLIEAELCGLNIDIPVATALRDRLETEQNALAEKIYKSIGKEINLNSSDQIRPVLFDKKSEGGLGLTPISMTAGKKASTNKEDLEKLFEKSKNPVLRNIVQYRRYGVLISTFLTGMINSINPITGKVHPTFKITGTETHRIVCGNPNLLNIPRDDPGDPEYDPEGSKIRTIFIPTPLRHGEPFEDRKVFVNADLAQAEIRVFASLSGDEVLTKMILDGIDIHAFFANRIYHKDNPIEDLKLFKTDELLYVERSKTKSMIFGTIYDQTPEGAEQQLGIPKEEAQRIIDEIYAVCPRGKIWKDEMKQFATKNGYAVTPWGVRRHLPILKQKDCPENKRDKAKALRVSCNSPIQTHASDYCIAAMIAIYHELKQKGIWFRPQLIIYDAIMLEVKLKDAEYVSQRLVKAMTRKAVGFNVPMGADVEIVDRWSGNNIDTVKSLEAKELIFA